MYWTPTKKIIFEKQKYVSPKMSALSETLMMSRLFQSACFLLR